MKEIEAIFQRIDNEIRDLKEAENTNVEQMRKIMNRQAEVITFLVGRVKDLEKKLDMEAQWDKDLEEIIKIMALDDSKIWKFRKHKEIYEAIARKGILETEEVL